MCIPSNINLQQDSETMHSQVVLNGEDVESIDIEQEISNFNSQLDVLILFQIQRKYWIIC